MHYLIGDLHSNIAELEKLLAILRPGSADTLVFLGDLIDKNPQTQQTFDSLAVLAKTCQCVFLKGDHEYVWDQYLNQGVLSRQNFLLKYDCVKALQEFTPKAKELIKNNRVAEIKKYLSAYLELITKMKDYYIVGGFLAVHAGLLPEQLEEKNLKFQEINYFIRPEKMDMDKKYLDKYIVVAAHTNLGEEPTVKPGYINIDLGAGYGKYLGAFVVEEKKVIRSDGKSFRLCETHYC